MHEESLTSLRVGNKRAEQYFLEMREELGRINQYLRELSKQTDRNGFQDLMSPVDASPGTTEENEGNGKDVTLEDEQADLDTMKHCIGVAGQWLETSAEKAYASNLPPPNHLVTKSAKIMAEPDSLKGDAVAAAMFQERQGLNPQPSLVLAAAVAPTSTAAIPDTPHAENLRTLVHGSSWHPRMVMKPETRIIADLTRKTGWWSTLLPLLSKSNSNNVEAAKILLELIPNATENPDAAGRTPIMIAAMHRNLGIVRFLLDKSNVKARDNEGKTVLHHAIPMSGLEASDLLETIELIVKQGAVVNELDNAGASPLYYCIKASKELTTSLLIRLGASINLQDPRAINVFAMAVRLRKADMVELLLKTGPKYDRRSLPETSIDIEYLLDEHEDNMQGSTPEVSRQMSVDSTYSSLTSGSKRSKIYSIVKRSPMTR